MDRLRPALIALFAKPSRVTPDAFLEISGVGQVKLRDFAEPFLEAIAKSEAPSTRT